MLTPKDNTMTTAHSPCGWLPIPIASRLASALVLCFSASLATAAPPVMPAPSQTLDLASCIHLALERQPRIAPSKRL